MSNMYGNDDHTKTYSSGDPSMSVPVTSSANTLLSPYLNIDPRYLNQDGAEYIFAGEAVKRRSIGERMFSNVGASYFTGVTIGGIWGLYEGLRNPHGTSTKLRVNSVLNACTRRGPFIGNSLGCLALMYTVTDGLIGMATEKDEYNAYNSIGAAVLTGAIFKSTGGVRSMGLAAAIGGSIALTYYIGLEFWRKEKPRLSTPNWSS